MSPAEVGRFYGKSHVTRNLEDAEVWGITEEASRVWWHSNVPIMRHYLKPGDGMF